MTTRPTPAEDRAMVRALELARRGWGRVEPNPLVGCVILRGEEVVGEGYHAEFGGDHAEVVALRAAGERAHGGTAVVTLEPCAHRGKTPPCTDALLEAEVGRVVVGMPDPTALAAGGAERLRERGVEVVFGVRGAESASLNGPFCASARQSDRPYVALKLATSLDGKIADAEGRSRWISGAEAREWAHWLRAGFDAIAVGGVTARLDDPSLTVRGSVTPRILPTRVIFSRSAHIPERAAIVQSASETPTVVVSEDPSRDEAAGLRALGVRILEAKGLRAGLSMLREQGIGRVLCEGGGRLGSELLAQNLVDRFYWVQAPIWLGSGAVPAFPRVPDSSVTNPTRWVVTERRPLGDDTLLVMDRETCSPA